MKISLLDAKSVARQLTKLIKKHDRISIAVAWGRMTSVAEILLLNKHKFESILLGLDFSASDPDLIDQLVDVPNAFIAKNRQGCFHPKIFYFQSGTKAEAIIGSSNFTKGGLGLNLEASIHVQGTSDTDFFEQVREQLKGYAPLRLPITAELAEGYRRQHKAASCLPRPKNPILPEEGRMEDWERINAPLAIMSWEDFVKQARQDVYHDFKRRIKVLRKAKKMFSEASSFENLPVAAWKAIAGVLGSAEAETEGLKDLDWGWFGSMGGAGTFASMIGRRSPKIAKAVDYIPKYGDITEAQFNKYVETFTEAFSAQSRTAGLAPATRLLAMKRPDFFVCANHANRKGLAEALSFAPTTLSLDNYWERVIEPIQQAPWYNEQRPTGQDMELWDARVAMLDAIYYRP